MLFSRKSVRCCASSNGSSKKNNIVSARKLFESKRLESLKENVNKLILIATGDTKEISDFVKELDQLHKEELNYNKNSKSKENEGEDENIFINEPSKE